MPTTKPCSVCQKPYGQGLQTLRWFNKSQFCSRRCSVRRTAELARQRRVAMTQNCINCGSPILFDERAKPYQRRSRKFCGSDCRSGVFHANWRGGRYEISKGYMRVNTRVGQTDYEHRVIAERVLGRPLKRDEVVHHIDGNKRNNTHSNLLICTNAYHRWLHEEMSNRYAQEHFGSARWSPSTDGLAC